MALPRNGRLYALTSLQIGDIQSYVSRLFLLVAYEGLKLVFLVDNGPWTVNTRPSRPAELWQLMVTKSRGSPFANRLRDYANGDRSGQQGVHGKESSDSRAEAGQEKEDGWLALLVALQQSCRERTQVKKPSHGLYGCVAFEVAWSDVRGINYTNELQMDTCVSLEVRKMTKREFDSLEQAQACYDTILSGSKDLGPSLNVSRKSNGKTGGTIVRCAGPDNSLQGLIPERSRSAKVHLDDSTGGGRSSGAVEKKHIRKRQIDDTGRAYENSDSATTANLLKDLSRAYISSLNNIIGNYFDPITAGNLPPEFFTPPSSPYSGQLHNLFKNYSSCQHKDPKKFRIVPVVDDDDEIESKVMFENRVLRLKQAGEWNSSIGSIGGEQPKAAYDKNQSSKISYSGSFEKMRIQGCSKCRMKREGTKLRDRAQDCVRCDTNAEVKQERIHITPDRLIAPAETYRDTLILFRFSEPLLPLELRQIITSDRRLLKMLESGLPPWVIFLQSYPILCHLYRPWMRPLCGTIYYLISVVTVLIGFYDLYKNVPVLKATAAHICGPLFEWIEEWGMVSRLKYLGTMLFLQNCEKAFEWTVAVTRASRQVSMLLMRPVLQPLISFGETFLPVWKGVSYGVRTMARLTSTTLYSIFIGISSILGILIWPFIAFLSTIWNLGKALLYPVFSAIWTVLILPLQLVRLVCSLVAVVSFQVTEALQNAWVAIQGGVQLLLVSGSPALKSLQIAKTSTSNSSIWRSLWNDILSKVFHAVNGIVKGLAAFITACNRHRLSIHNQVVEFLFRVSHMLKSSQYLALTTCRQIFLQSGASETGSATVVDEVEPSEPEAQEVTQFSSDLPPNLRHRLKGDVLSSPLLMEGEEQGILSLDS